MLVVAIQRGQSADREFWFLAPGVFDAAFVECGCAQRSGFVPKQRSTLTPAIPLDKPWWADCVELQRRQPVEAKSLTLAASRRTPAIEAIAPDYSSRLESTASLKAHYYKRPIMTGVAKSVVTLGTLPDLRADWEHSRVRL